MFKYHHSFVKCLFFVAVLVAVLVVVDVDVVDVVVCNTDHADGR